MLALLMAACTSDTETMPVLPNGGTVTVPKDGDSDLLQLIPFMRPSEEMATRAAVIPDGYESFKDVYHVPEGVSTSFGIFLAEEGNTPLDRMGMITYQGIQGDKDIWRSYVEVKQKQYYVYGFLPAEAATNGATLTAYNGDYENGAVLTISGLKAASSADVCVITGVQDASSANAEIDLHLGRFAYLGKPKGQNYVGVLVDHLYSEIDFRFKVDAEYYALRRIKLKKLTLKSVGRDKMTATVRLVANTTDSNPIAELSWSTPTSGSSDAVIFDNEAGKEILTEATEFGELRGFSAPAATNSLAIVCEYDVYDVKGNLVRPNCRAENNLSFKVVELKPGEKSVVTITVKPTYLYVLSDPDLDNPTIDVN
jgi:hypothetical protein